MNSSDRNDLIKVYNNPDSIVSSLTTSQIQDQSKDQKVIPEIPEQTPPQKSRKALEELMLFNSPPKSKSKEVEASQESVLTAVNIEEDSVKRSEKRGIVHHDENATPISMDIEDEP